MNRVALTVLAVALVVLSGCGTLRTGEDRAVAEPAPDAPVTDAPIVDQPIPVEPDGGPGGGPMVVEPQPGMADVRPIPWESAEVDRDAMTLTLVYWSGVEPCNVLDRVEIAYGDAAVTATIFEGHDPNAGDVACIEIAQQKQVTVELAEDIGQRSLVDGAA